MKLRLLLALEVVVLASAAEAQVQSVLPVPQRSFEVATVIPHAPSAADATFRGGGNCHGSDSVYGPNRRGAPPPLGRCVMTSVTLNDLVYMAYGLVS